MVPFLSVAPGKMPRVRSLTVAQARRIALAAQGFGRSRPTGKTTRRHLDRLLGNVGLIQIDSVNVLTRAHYLPGWSRLGGYDRARLDRLAYHDHALFEYWGHEAALLPVELHPLMRWRMHRAELMYETWGRMARLAQEQPGLVEHVLSLVRDKGPLTAGDIASEEKRSKDHWGWNWSDEKTALEYLFYSGKVSVDSRRNFERVYDVTERVIPQPILQQPTPTEEEAHRGLLLIAAQRHGVATISDLADYFRIKVPLARPRVAELVEDGKLEQVEVKGWRHPAFAVPDAQAPRRVNARALLVPFDPVVWERDRTERLFGFRYRIEIYVPPPKRVHGYYVLPFLLGDRLVARVDLKSDRQAGVLRVQSAWAEPDSPPDTVPELAAELRGMAEWLDLSDVVVTKRGDLAQALATAVQRLR
jgi:uncharacterized protein YcaQ